ncbi:MAG TPA: ATP-binding cassette domain-containing protein, partial [Candidatus Saccharimonadales bacterium]|nr:ATP-binding cassette domain-containing protein [Candidatus Saccharimonadales bacterium]
VLVITHDRDVLREVDRIIEIKDGKAFSYNGNYDAYLRQNTVSTTTKMHDFEVIQRQIANLKAKVIQFRRLKEKARDPDTIKQFKRRENEAAAELAALEKLEKPTFWIDRESSENLNYKVGENYEKYKAKNIKINTTASQESRSRRLLVEASELSLGYTTPLFSNINIALRENERLELRGRNGAGKTTLIKAILAKRAEQPIETLKSGSLTVDRHVTIGVYEQEVSPKYFAMSLRDAIIQLHIDKGLKATDEIAMRLMSDYLFEPQTDGHLLISQLSGGQKARFQLISMLATKPQLLILDEPTNHLDLPSIEELEAALSRYSGAIIYVSHDSYFRAALASEVVQIGSRSKPQIASVSDEPTV